MMITTMRNGFSSKEEFKKSLEMIEPYYKYNKPNFFTYANAIYKSVKQSEYKDNIDIKSYLHTIYLGIDCIQDEGWQFSKWQEKERKDIIPALLTIYDVVEGFDWSKMNEMNNF